MFSKSWVFILFFSFQILMSCVCFLFVFLLSGSKQKNVPNRLIGVAFMGMWINVTYCQEMLATNIQHAMSSVIFQIMGITFYTTLLLLFVSDYCQVKLQKWFLGVIMLANWLFISSVWAYRRTSLFLDVLYLEYWNDIPRIRSVRGPLNWMMHALVILQLLICVLLITDKLIKTQSEQEKKRLYYMMFSALLPLVAEGIACSGLLKAVNPFPAAVALGFLIFTISVVVYRAFDIITNAHEKLMDEMDIAVIVTDTNKGFVEANKKAYELFPEIGVYKSGQQLSDLGEKESSLFSGKHLEYRKGDNVYECYSNPVYSGNVLIGYTVLFVDQTENRKQMEYLENLQKQTEVANRAKTDFLAKVSHEIRTPINSIIGMDEMILRECEEKDIIGYATDIKSSAAALLSFINDILDTTKIEAGKIEILPVKYELSTLLSDLVSMISIRALEKDLQFEVEVAPYLPNVLKGDDIRIRQIVLNLLTNAIKYTFSGKVSLRVKGYADGKTAMLRFEVEDTGNGIKQEDIPKMFESFERIALDVNRNIEGTGLGMSITTKFLNLMGSELMVESEYGKGSIFWFDLEQEILEDTPIGDFQNRVKKATEREKYEAAFEAPDCKVLMVDDNKINRVVFVNLLKQTKVQVTAVASGRECLELIQKEHYDLIFMDHMMPEMDGVETFQEMKKISNHMCTNTPVIMLTANAGARAREEYLMQGFAEFLPKPVNPAQLENMMIHYLPENKVKKNSIMYTNTEK